MKKSFLLLITLIVSIAAMANPVTPDEARQKITQFMAPRRASAISPNPEVLKLVVTNHYKIQDKTLAPSLYVFNVSDGQGYVIASADDRFPAVLGYSDRGNINPNNMPENMRAWLKSYSDQMEYLNNHPDAAAPLKTVTGDAIAPLLGPIEWDQSSPYNDLCPLDGDTHSLTGCVATAMAQLMYFWKYPNATTDVIPGYTSKDKGFQMSDIPAKTSIDWENMLPQYKGNETEAQKQAVANLMLLCGTSLQMNYSKDFSGAFGGDVAIALRSYFDYDLATSFELHEKYRAAVWNQMVYNELKAGRPVYYDGDSSGSGHAFVVDGYGGDDYFHVNWGWGGSSNDYFLLSILDSKNNSGAGATQSADGYSMGQGAIFGMQPNTGVTPIEDPILTTDNWYVDSLVIYRAKAGEDFVFKVGFNFYNNTNNTYTFDTGIGVYSTSGNLNGVLPGYRSEMPSGYGLYDPSTFPQPFSLGSDTDSEEFFLRPVCRLTGTEEWKETFGAEYYYIHAVIKGDTLTLNVPTFGLTGTLASTGKKEVGSPLPVTAKITNKGTIYLGQIYFVVDGKMVGGRHFDLDPGDSTTVDFSFTPEKAGKSSVSVCTRKWNNEAQKYDYIPFIADSIDVATSPKIDLGISLSVDNITDGYIKENAIKLKASIKNNSANVYDNIIKAELYKDKHDGSGYYGFEKMMTQTVKVENGETIDVNFNFENLEDDNYLIYVSYISEGEWVTVKNAYTIYTRPIPKISTTPQTTNAVKENGAWLVKADSALVSVKVKNVGTVDYDDDIFIYLYKMYNENTGNRVATVSTPIQLAAGADTTVVMQLDGLENEARYFYNVYYMAGPKTAKSAQSNIFTAKVEEKGYYLVSQLNNWSTTDQSYPFTKLDDGKTWEITFPSIEWDIYLKIAPASAYKHQENDEFWNYLLGAPEDQWTPLEGSMVVNGGAWLLPVSLNAESYTMRIVPSEMTYTIIPQYKEAPFVPQPPYYYVGDNTGWSFDAEQAFTDLGNNIYTYTFKPNYNADGLTWFKVAPANAISSAGEITWGHLYCPNNAYERTDDKYTGTLVIADGDAWILSKTDEAESYTVTIDLSSKTYIVEPNKSTGIRMVNGQQGTVAVYDMKGNKVAEAKSIDVQQRMKSLPKGLYIVRSGQKSKTIRN